ncbi:2188_t:CDS:2, partial [Dentiscutata erythropus]
KIAARKVGQGVIYVNIHENLNDSEGLGRELARAINFKQCISFMGQLARKIMGPDSIRFEDSKWESALNAFERAAAVYKKKYKKLPVLVFDNINVLDKVHPEIIDLLQDNAKMSVDSLKYVVVFVTNERSVLNRMKESSAWSRASEPVTEIEDFTEGETIDYLVNKRKVCNDAEAKKLHELIGGRITVLNSMATRIEDKKSFEDIKQNLFTKISKQFRKAEINEGQLYHEKVKPLIKALLENDDKGLEYNMALEIVQDDTMLDELLKANVLAYHPAKDTLTFHSRSVR